MTDNERVLREALQNAIDSPTVEALAALLSPRRQGELIGKSLSEHITEILLPRLTAALASTAAPDSAQQEGE